MRLPCPNRHVPRDRPCGARATVPAEAALAAVAMTAVADLPPDPAATTAAVTVALAAESAPVAEAVAVDFAAVVVDRAAVADQMVGRVRPRPA